VMEKIQPIDREVFHQKLKKLLDAANRLQTEECLRIFREVMEPLRLASYEDCTFCLLQMAYELILIIDGYAHSDAYVSPAFDSNLFIGAISHADNLRMIEASFDDLFSSLEQIHPKHNVRTFQHMSQVKSYIEEHYNDPDLSVSKLASIVGVSPSHLGKIFLEYTQITISNYLADIRIATSKELLEDSRIPINDIASQVGFTSDKYFYKVFKDTTGMTPNVWRQRASAAAEQAKENKYNKT